MMRGRVRVTTIQRQRINSFHVQDDKDDEGESESDNDSETEDSDAEGGNSLSGAKKFLVNLFCSAMVPDPHESFFSTHLPLYVETVRLGGCLHNVPVGTQVPSRFYKTKFFRYNNKFLELPIYRANILTLEQYGTHLRDLKPGNFAQYFKNTFTLDLRSFFTGIFSRSRVDRGG